MESKLCRPRGRVLLIAPRCQRMRVLTERLRVSGWAVDSVDTLPAAFARLDLYTYDAILAHRALDARWPFGVQDALRFGASRQPLALLGLLVGCPERDTPSHSTRRLRLHFVNAARSTNRCQQLLHELHRLVREISPVSSTASDTGGETAARS